MFQIFTRRFCTRSAAQLFERANKETEKRRNKIYEPYHQEEDIDKKMSLLYSGKVWLDHAELEKRPKSIHPEVREELKSLDCLKSEKKIMEYDLLRDQTWWIPFRDALTHHSTAIEGNSLNLKETELVLDSFARYSITTDGILDDLDDSMIVNGREVPIEDIREVVDHGKAMEYYRKVLLSQTPLTEDVIVNLNKIVYPVSLSDDTVPWLLKDTKYRRIQVHIEGSLSVCPSPYELPVTMKRFLEIHSENSKVLHPVLSAIQMHANFIQIHPFQGGNGRTARILTNLELYRSGYFGLIIPRKERQEYFKLLEAEREHDNTEYFMFMISKIKDTINTYLP